MKNTYKNYETMMTTSISSEEWFLEYEENSVIDKIILEMMIFTLVFVENCLKYYATHNFSVLLRTSSNPADINRFQSHTGKGLAFILHTLVIIEFLCIFLVNTLPLSKICHSSGRA